MMVMQLKRGLFVNESISYSSSRIGLGMKLVLGLDGCMLHWVAWQLLITLICYLNLGLAVVDSNALCLSSTNC